ncbi:hypothetical protein [Nocardioides sp.]|uniref:hypothetical protein n=1 Tax=Nocardioides sp. TaxID=35761 RepID=UPI002C65DFE6|nr:hypothetical protein [Nocardioides sp.]HSX67299.1 hypothetical protein [Nocardioides sp.]
MTIWLPSPALMLFVAAVISAVVVPLILSTSKRRTWEPDRTAVTSSRTSLAVGCTLVIAIVLLLLVVAAG